MLDTTPLLMLAITVHQAGEAAQQRVIEAAKHLIDHHRNALADDTGQATTEYALVLLAAALVGVLVIGWATAGGGAAAIGRLFDSVIESVINQV